MTNLEIITSLNPGAEVTLIKPIGNLPIGTVLTVVRTNPCDAFPIYAQYGENENWRTVLSVNDIYWTNRSEA